MNCDQIRSLHTPYLDSELDAKTSLEFQEHLDACPLCARMLASEAKLDAEVKAHLTKGERSAELWIRIEQSVAAAAQSRSQEAPRTETHRQPSSDWLRRIQSQLRLWLWPHPNAWAALASVWLILLIVNAASENKSPAAEVRMSTSITPKPVQALRQQEQLLAELMGSSDSLGKPPPSVIDNPPRPRSQKPSLRRNA